MVVRVAFRADLGENHVATTWLAAILTLISQSAGAFLNLQRTGPLIVAETEVPDARLPVLRALVKPMMDSPITATDGTPWIRFELVEPEP